MAPLETLDAADEMPTRHEPQLFTVPTVPVDPYLAWCNQREAQGASTSTAIGGRFTRRLRRNGTAKAPWERILVKLSGDGR